MLAVDVERYGKIGRLSCLADLIEVTALNASFKKANVADAVRDNRWVNVIWDMFSGDPASSLSYFGSLEADEVSELKEQDQASEIADAVWVLLTQRAEALGSAYPFEISDSAIVRRRPRTRAHHPYLLLLCIAIDHAFDVRAGVNPRELFERVVTRTLESVGLEPACLGEVRRRTSSFEAAVDEVCRSLGLPSQPLSALYRTRANDEGVDIVARAQWRNTRRGEWLYIGQITCADSDAWDRKINEPKRSLWKAVTANHVAPSAFLAVPHHVENAALYKLMTDNERFVLDRLQLVVARALVPEERAFVDRVLASLRPLSLAA